ncbi:hypothetical protein GGI07_005630 [Coemansia sp. Benny D115]|nr:hypothetical protein GGI07_005630 [Coemansia sp. Benny D115]
MIVMEHNSGGELLHYVRQKGRLHENEARGFFRQIVSAMDYIHRNCMVHRDLKLENVMLTHDNRIRIIDFGFANIFNWDKTLSTFCGSPLYISPEIVNGVKYTGPEVDIWSMGVILFFMVSGCMPFESQERKEVFYKIARGRFTMPMFLSTEAQNLIQQMLTVSSKYRITMKGVIEHPWTNKDYSELINNYLPYRSPVVFQPNEQTLQKMRIYKYNIESTISALARSDMMYTPIVCIYHLIEEARLRKELRAKRQAQALHLGRHREGGSAATSGLSSPCYSNATANK